ncbi:deaminase domain-containing protein [Bacillus cytotoxicus]
MDVHYKSKHWQQMKDGINEITKDAITNLRQADELLEDIQERIQDLDSDRCIDFYHRKQEKKINTLLEDYTTLQNYCDKAGQIVYEHIDEPFYKKMDEFAQTMRDISIRDFQTKNRIGATTTTTLPSSHAYGVPQTITTKKEKITVDDIFKDSLAFDHVLRAQYKEVKKQNPDAKLNYKEYRQLIPSMRGFEYTSIEDEQKKLEAWRDVAISGALIITTIFCPPLGIAASVVYGGLQVKSAIEGKDWGTHRKLSKEEQVEAGFFGALDLVPGLGLATKAFKGTIDLGSLAKLTKWKEGIADFNPNIGKNVVQSLKDNETLKNALHTWKKTKVPVGIRSADTGMGIKIPHIEHATVGEIAENLARVRATAKEDAYQLAKGNGGSGVKGTGKVYPTRQIDSVTEAHIIDRVKELRGNLTSRYKKSGNFAVAEVDVSGISKSEFYAQSSINELKGNLEHKVPDISLQPENPMFKATEAVGKEGESYLRNTDTEYKILNDIASRLGENTQATGKIKLFTELDTCDSCSKVIAEFAAKYKNIELEVIHNNGNRIIP